MRFYVINKDTIFEYLGGTEAAKPVENLLNALIEGEADESIKIYYEDKGAWYSCMPTAVFSGIRNFISALGSDYCLVPDEELENVLEECAIEEAMKCVTHKCERYWEVEPVTNVSETEEFIIRRKNGDEVVYEAVSNDIMSALTEMVKYLDEYDPDFFKPKANIYTDLFKTVMDIFGDK